MMKCSQRCLLIAPAILALAATLGCGSSSSSSSSSVTAPTPTVITETFTGTITQNSSAVFNFTVNNSGYSLLAGFTSISPASVTALGIGIGAWDASSQTCGLNQSQSDTARSGSTALSGTAAAGAFCVRVYDAGNVGADVTASFTVQVQHY
jgi:cytoskeletal protein RodZ